MMPDRKFWGGRRVFLTGHTGFKGSWMSIWLRALGADVTGYALPPPTQPNLFEQAGVGKLIHSISADIRDFQRMKSALEECRPEVIIHMAAQTVVRRGYEDPIETYSTNVMGTVNLFESVRQIGHRCVIVNVTSDKCYENREWLWAYRECDVMGGHDPYSNSKGCAELVTSAYRNSFFSPAEYEHHGVGVASARAGNVIGGGDWTAHQLIPDLMRAFLGGNDCLIRNPAATRPWQFVLEPLRGYLMLAERLAQDPVTFADGWNFGPSEDDAKPVSWIADRLSRSWGSGAEWTHDGSLHPHEANLLKLDASKAKFHLNWHPVLPLESALDWIVTWYRAFQQESDLAELTLAQIQQYEAISS
jgi:CDP-glucose 4,6-dehydratase